MNIVIKSDRNRLEIFEKIGFQYYELYLSSYDQLEKIPETSMQLYTIHAPHNAQTEGQLRKLIHYAKKCSCAQLIVHADRFPFEMLEKVKHPDVQILVENVPLVHGVTHYHRYPFVIDIEHLYQSAVIQNKEPHKFVAYHIEKYINSGAEVRAVHVSGVDYTTFDVTRPPPLVGEHLPLCFKGTISDIPVIDRAHHDTWAQKLFPYIDAVVLEIHDRKDYDIYEESLSSKKYIEELWKKYRRSNGDTKQQN
jgi:hypothetical protein